MSDLDWNFKCVYLEDLLNGSITRGEGFYSAATVICVEDGDKTALYMRLKNGTEIKLLYVV